MGLGLRDLIFLVSKHYSEAFFLACQDNDIATVDEFLKIVKKISKPEDRFNSLLNPFRKYELRLVANMMRSFELGFTLFACRNGNLDLVNKLLEVAKAIDERDPELKIGFNMIAADEYRAFTHAYMSGNIMVIDRLLKAAREIDPTLGLVSNMIQREEYRLCTRACGDGDIEIFESLLAAAEEIDKKNPGFVFGMMQASNFAVFRKACFAKNVRRVDRILEVARKCDPTLGLVSNMMQADNFAAFTREACQSGNIDVVDRLLKVARELENKDPGFVSRMMRINNFKAYRSACASGNIEAVDRLFEVVRELDQVEYSHHTGNMMQTNEFEAVVLACKNKNLEFFNKLVAAARDIDVDQDSPAFTTLMMKAVIKKVNLEEMSLSGGGEFVKRFLSVVNDVNLMGDINRDDFLKGFVFSVRSIADLDQFLAITRKSDEKNPGRNLLLYVMQAHEHWLFRNKFSISVDVFNRLLAVAKELERNNPGLDLVSNMLRANNYNPFKQSLSCLSANPHLVRKVFRACTKIDPSGNFWKGRVDEGFRVLGEGGRLNEITSNLLTIVPHNYLLEKVRTNAYPRVNFDRFSDDLVIDETQIRLVNLAFEVGAVRGRPAQNDLQVTREVLIKNTPQTKSKENLAERTKYAKALSYYRIVDEAYDGEKLPIERELTALYKEIKDTVSEHLNVEECYEAAKQSLDISSEQIAIFEARRVIVDILENYDQIANFRLASYKAVKAFKALENEQSASVLPNEMKLKIMEDERVSNDEYYTYKSEFGAGVDRVVNLALRKFSITEISKENMDKAKNAFPPRTSPADAGAAAAASRDGDVVSPS